MNNQVSVTKYPESGQPFMTGGQMSGLNPLSLLRGFTDEMDRLFAGNGRSRGEADLWAPAVEVAERDGKLVISADLPGIRKEDVKVEVRRNSLTLQGERRQAHEEKHEGYYQSERSYGRFSRTIALPEGANADQANAELLNGTLEISMPMAANQASRRQIPVQEGKSKSSGPN